MQKLLTDIPEDFYKEETRSGFLVTTERKKIWAVEIDLLCVFMNVCNKHGLRFYADGGTLLGAVRHGGFIPWDDDVDLVMPRDDYTKLCEVAGEEFREPYFFQTEYTDPGSMRCHAQLRNSGTTGILTKEIDKHYSFNQGIFIDIFPLDSVPDDEKERMDFFAEAGKKRRNAFRFAGISTRYQHRISKPRDVLKFILFHTYGKNRKNKYYRDFEDYIQKYNGNEENLIAKMSFKSIPERRIWEKKWFSESVFIDYEFVKVPIPAGYNELLNRFYGSEWETPVQAAATHGSVLFDTDKPYTLCLNKF